MRILIVPSWYPTRRSPVNGIFVREQARALSQTHDVRVLYLDVLPRGHSRRSRRQIQQQDGFTEEIIEVTNRPLLWQCYYLWQMYLALKGIRQNFRPDVIHCHVAVPAGWGVAILKRVAKVPIVLTEHSSEFKSWLKRPGLSWMARRAFQGANLIVAVSQGQKHLMERTFPTRTPIRVVPNMVDTNRFSASPLPTKVDGYKLLFVGLLETEQKGLHFLLVALAHLKRNSNMPIHLTIVGDGILRKKYETQATQLGLNRVVEFIGTKSNTEVAELIKCNHALVLPSLHESQGLAAIESLASGRPVIATRCGGPEYLINESNGLVVEPAQTEHLAKAIELLLLHLDDYNPEIMSTNAAKLYSYDSVTAILTEVYEDLKHHKHEPGPT